MGSPTFFLSYKTDSRSTAFARHFQAVDLNDAKRKAREFLRSIVLPTDRPGTSLKWAYIKHEGKEIWLVQKED